MVRGSDSIYSQERQRHIEIRTKESIGKITFHTDTDSWREWRGKSDDLRFEDFPSPVQSE